MILALMVTEQCDFHCMHCMINSSPKFSLVSDKVVERFYHMLSVGQPDKVVLLGGEPLLHLDKIEEIVTQVKPVCEDIEIFSNGSFLLDSKKAKRIRSMEINVIISDDVYHRRCWPSQLESLIYDSGYKVLSVDDSENMIPVGRAYEKFKHLEYNLGCSLVTGNYGKGYKNACRYMLMLNGDVNLYCSTLEGSLANVFEDEKVTYDLLVQREKILHNYLFSNVIKSIEDTYMAKMCNECSQYKVTQNAIYYSGKFLTAIENENKWR